MDYFLDRTIRIQKLESLPGRKFAYSTATGTLYAASIQPLSTDEVQSFDGQIGRLYAAYVGITVPIQEGDRVISGTTAYKVKGIKVYDFGAQQYQKLILATDKNE